MQRSDEPSAGPIAQGQRPTLRDRSRKAPTFTAETIRVPSSLLVDVALCLGSEGEEVGKLQKDRARQSGPLHDKGNAACLTPNCHKVCQRDPVDGHCVRPNAAIGGGIQHGTRNPQRHRQSGHRHIQLRAAQELLFPDPDERDRTDPRYIEHRDKVLWPDIQSGEFRCHCLPTRRSPKNASSMAVRGWRLPCWGRRVDQVPVLTFLHPPSAEE